MTIKILINGAAGRMGQEACKAIAKEKDFVLVGICEHHEDLAEKIKTTGAQIVVDFTTPTAVFENTCTIIKAGAHPVIGTTGLSDEQIKILSDECSQLKRGGIIAPNFSIGVLLLMKYASDAARYFPDVEIIEMHHNQKKDAPSGSSIKLAHMLAQARTSIPKDPTEKETIPGTRGGTVDAVPIHSVRLPGLVAHEMIIFGAAGGTLTLRHDCIDRASFMPGLLLACRQVMGLEGLLYGLESLI